MVLVVTIYSGRYVITNVDNLWFKQDEATCHASRETVALLHEQFPERAISLQHHQGNSDNGYNFPCTNRRRYSECSSNKLFQFSLKFVSLIKFSKLVLNLLQYLMKPSGFSNETRVTYSQLKACISNVLIAFYNLKTYSLYSMR